MLIVMRDTWSVERGARPTPYALRSTLYGQRSTKIVVES